jgi:predicted nucleic acid-binding Zn ribbon protein
MITYVYETIPTKEGEQPKRYEIRQSITEPPLKVHPETGEQIRRVITGGLGITGVSRKSETPASSHVHSGGCCGGGQCGLN